ncbi:ParB/RepB/Spo0J family partition protein [Dermatophilus congolensis]|uniref:ParB/RepB/Spo0J family partition protein n=1 Tax=Dermatophilus congolensis TaxID=1863 RepID=UPI001AAE328F|nr:ParB/RepB/Spo0J family partition protein [Dermatophilus congolensis]MBO3143888.1 ParB/RepB/Spo0J family partition protein [Dermatophilus congolensis]MBO3152879.1 ParB/RepB/Spo0J family partition protein [Dermatophilus congolensis]MBO3160111.1 ParB/RepB/Spo0J family partition protein [Dermatophilus congolensis]MBO3164164.1 ParB/RepB/Spo0J family partition protein [Dermatophilus congolensis]MBO3177710.1 ParB/RepB/Spo0J family partition protein [Dermatophilus congolensis]
MSNDRQRGLGRGLGALIPTDVPRESLAAKPRSARPLTESVSAVQTRPADLFFESDVTRRTRESASLSAAASGRKNKSSAPTDSQGRRAALDKAFESVGRAGADVSSSETDVAQSNSDVSRETKELSKIHLESEGEIAITSTDPLEGVMVKDDLSPVPGIELAQIDIDAIHPNAKQPRTVFDEQELDELVASIKEIGILQPIVVRHSQEIESGYELIMGERRWRASRIAGLQSVPAIIKSTPDDAMLRDALLENLHRVQLNPLEEAAAYQQLLDDFGCTHEELADRVARSRPQISNTLRLLRLPPLVARRVAAGVLTAGHARALLGLSDAAAIERLAQRIVAEGLSVRTVEEIVAVSSTNASSKPRRPRSSQHNQGYEDLAARLTDRLDTHVTINMGRKKGKLTVEFAGREDLDRILKAIDSTCLAEESESIQET